MNQDAGMNMDMGMQGANKKQNGMKYGMAALAVLALAGIGFGIYGMTQVKSAKQQISDMKIEIKNTDGTTTTLETDKIEVKEADKTVVIADTANVKSGPYIDDNYFVVPEWNVKFPLSDQLTGYGFSVSQNSIYSNGPDAYKVSLTAIRKDDMPTGQQQAQTVDDVFTCTMATISRQSREYIDSNYRKDNVYVTGKFIDYSDDYTFWIMTAKNCSVARDLNRLDIIDAATEIIVDDILSKPESIQ